MEMRPQAAFLSLLPVLAAFAFGAQPGFAQEVRARVVDERSRNAIVGADATLLAPDSTELARTTSGPEGFFLLSAPAAGSYLVRVEQLGYTTEIRPVTLQDSQALIPAFVLYVAAIALDTLQVEFSPSEITRQGSTGPARPAYLLSGERMAVLDRAGVSFFSAAQELNSSIRLRDVNFGERKLTCIESRRASSGMGRGGGGCRNPAIVINGQATGLDGTDALLFFQSLHVTDWESLEFLSPMDAGFLYGMLASSRGALVLWSRGQGPHRSEARGGGG